MSTSTTNAPRTGNDAHTPTPWRAVIHSRSIEGKAPNQFSYPIKPVGGSFVIANVTLAYPETADNEMRLDYAQGEANAAFIVRAVNSHAALVEALERIVAISENRPAIRGRPVIRTMHQMEGVARIALAAARNP